MAQGMIQRVAVLIFVALALSACGSLTNPTSFWRGSEYWNSADPADRALAAIERGDYSTAKRHADEARQRDPADPYALFASALVYQNIGQPQMAYDYYQSILSIQPIGTIAQGSQGSLTQRPIVDVARENLEALKRAHPGLTGTRALAPYAPAQGAATAAAPPRTVGGIPYGAGTTDWGIPLETNRLLTLKNLYDQGLITESEFAARRDANKGYALPYSNPTPPAAGLERTAPTAHDVSTRLKAISKALEKGIIVSDQHADERNAILNSLLSPAPGAAGRRPPPPSPQELVARRNLLNALLREGIINQDELTRESGAMDAAARMAAYQAQQPSTSGSGKKTPAALLPGGNKGAVSPTSSTPGTDLSVQPRLGAKSGQVSTVLPSMPRSTTPPTADLPEFRQMEGCTMGAHLSSLSSEAAAIQEWAQLQRKYPQQLGNLKLSVTRADLGARGIFYQVKAGPLDVTTARSLCTALKARGQPFCEVGSF